MTGRPRDGALAAPDDLADRLASAAAQAVRKTHAQTRAIPQRAREPVELACFADGYSNDITPEEPARFPIAFGDTVTGPITRRREVTWSELARCSSSAPGRRQGWPALDRLRPSPRPTGK
jgi:hypothetical protein